MRGIFAILLVALLIGGCAAPGGSTAPDSGPESTVPVGGTTSTGVKGPGSADEYGPEARAKMDLAWRAFKDDSPEWPRLRQEWIDLGQRATNTLVENLYRAMVAAAGANFSAGFERARSQLILLGELAVPTLSAVLEENQWYSPRTGQSERLPSGIVSMTTEIIALAGESSVPWLARLTTEGTSSVRRSAADGLGKIGSRKSVAPLASMLRGASDWSDRMVAAKALGYLAFPDSERALVAALEDSDDSVVEVAARSLAHQRATGSLSALDERRRRAQDQENYAVAAACGAAAKAIRGGR